MKTAETLIVLSLNSLKFHIHRVVQILCKVWQKGRKYGILCLLRKFCSIFQTNFS